MRVGCIALIPALEGNFIGINCSKGRGLILPGGAFEWEKDPTFHHTAAREAYEETSLEIDHQKLRYLWQGPDGFGFQVLTFLYQGMLEVPDVDLPEGKPCIVSPKDTYKSKFGGYYRCLFEECQRELWTFVK